MITAPEASRTAKSIKNSGVALMMYFISLVLQFFSRKVFLDYLGAEVLGLNTTASSLLQFLNIAELGIGAAVAYTLYKPLFEKDYPTICEIVSIQGWLYRRIAYVIIGGAVLLMSFFPWIFSKMELPLWYAYASFGVLLFGALLSYFANYRQIVLSADQKDYKIQYSYKAIMIAKVLFQLVFIKYFADGYVWWLVWEAVFAIGGTLALNRVIRQTYPYLHTEVAMGRKLALKYPDIVTKIKQIFAHKINSYAVGQLTPVIIYSFASLTEVANYGNYVLITSGLGALFTAVTNSMGASVGNLVASSSDDERVKNVFGQLFSLRHLIIATCCFVTYSLASSFITLWVGEEYLLDDGTLCFIVLLMFLTMSRGVTEQFVSAYGMFYDVWAAVAEALSIVLLSVLGGYFFGLHGILGGSVIGMAVFVLGWKPCFLFIRGFKGGIWKYYVKYAVYTVMTLLTWALCHRLLASIAIAPTQSVGSFLGCGLLYAVVFCTILACGLAVVSGDFRVLFRRFFH